MGSNSGFRWSYLAYLTLLCASCGPEDPETALDPLEVDRRERSRTLREEDWQGEKTVPVALGVDGTVLRVGPGGQETVEVWLDLPQSSKLEAELAIFDGDQKIWSQAVEELVSGSDEPSFVVPEQVFLDLAENNYGCSQDFYDWMARIENVRFVVRIEGRPHELKTTDGARLTQCITLE